MHAVEDFFDRHALGIASSLARDVLETDHLCGLDSRSHRRGGHGRRRAAEAGGDILMNGARGAQHDDALHGVLELADVAGPVILDEDAHGVGRDLDLAAVLGVEPGQEMIDEHRDLFAPLPQRRDADLDDVQAVVEVFTELMRPHGRLEVAIGGGDEPHVGADGLLAAHARELAVLEHVQQLGLKPQRHLADLVEQERALVRRLELSGFLPVGSGERALLVTEQLRLEQLAGKGGAVHLQELAMGARRRLVDRPGHHFLADSALASQQHCRVGGGHLGDEVSNRLHLGASTEVQLLLH